ncbi:MAG: NAD-dependent epimerase/dehydratase family protein [Steroidobacteraceae bacterium]
MTARIMVLDSGSFIGLAMMRQLAASDWAEPVPDSDGAAEHAGRLAAALAFCDGVVDCAMGSASKLTASANALAGALRNAPAGLRVVHVGSMAVYGSACGHISETAPLRADLGAYAAARIDAECRLRAARPDITVIRPGIEYGPGGWLWSLRIAKLLAARRLGDLGAAGDGYCNLVHVDDVALAAVRALRLSGARGATFNLSLPAPPTWNEYFTRFAVALRAVPVRRIGARRQRIEAKLLAPPLKVLEIAAGKVGMTPGCLPSPIPASLWRLCGQDIRLDVRHAETVLGMVWRPLDAELQECAASYRAALP